MRFEFSRSDPSPGDKHTDEMAFGRIRDRECSEGRLAMNTTITSPDKMTEALRLLDEAARERRQELPSLRRVATRAKERAVETAKKTATGVDKHVRSHPWPYIGGVAATGVLLGYLAARKRK